jgi:hypothetical protein
VISSHFPNVSLHHDMAAGGGGLQMWRVAANLLCNMLRTANEG